METNNSHYYCFRCFSTFQCIYASPIQWTWTWANSGRWWGTGGPGMHGIHGFAKSRTRLGDWISTKICYLGVSGGSDGKVSVCNAGDRGIHPQVGKIPWRWAWQLTPTFLLGESHGQRSLVGYSPQGPKESNMTKHVISLSHMYLYMYKHTCILNNFCNLLFKCITL